MSRLINYGEHQERCSTDWKKDICKEKPTQEYYTQYIYCISLINKAKRKINKQILYIFPKDTTGNPQNMRTNWSINR